MRKRQDGKLRFLFQTLALVIGLILGNVYGVGFAQPDENPSSIPAVLKVYEDLEVMHLGLEESEEIPEMSVKLVRVVSDSRCPEGAHCFFIGSATIEIELSTGEKQKQVELTIKGRSLGKLPADIELPWSFTPIPPTPESTAEWLNTKIYLANLEPYPTFDPNRSQQTPDYVASFFFGPRVNGAKLGVE